MTVPHKQECRIQAVHCSESTGSFNQYPLVPSSTGKPGYIGDQGNFRARSANIGEMDQATIGTDFCSYYTQTFKASVDLFVLTELQHFKGVVGLSEWSRPGEDKSQ